MTIQAYAAKEPKGKLELFEYDPGELRSDEVEIDVDYCGICHSDLSMWGNDWKISEFPFVPGHEISGRVSAKGENVKHLEIGAKVGLGWSSRSCGFCKQCLSGNHNLCRDSEDTIVGRHGGFANKVRSHALWAIPIPEGVDPVSAGPLFCGGLTVFNPIIQNQISPTDRVAVIGIGGLGHMALQFLNKWGCEVTAFSTSPDKEEKARKLGAHRFVNVKDEGALKKEKGRFDMILSTVNVELEWGKYLAALAPKGKFHLVGAAPKIESAVMPLISGERSIGGSPVGSPATAGRMLEFCARHNIEPATEIFPLSEANEAMAKLEADSPSHRIVLKNDFS